jgi:hypothetical protein
MSEHRSAPEPGGQIDHEIDVRLIARVGAWLAVVTVAGFIVAWGFYRFLSRGERQLDARPSPIAEASRPAIIPGPPLQTTPERDLAALRKSEQARLTGWAWVDRANGVAQVPVEKAIETVAADGALPSFQPPVETGASK